MGGFESTDREANRGHSTINACLSFNLVFSFKAVGKYQVAFQSPEFFWLFIKYLEQDTVHDPKQEMYSNMLHCTGYEPNWDNLTICF